MIRPIVQDSALLQTKAELATKSDTTVITDLLDTLKAHQKDCVGMAANMIGVNKRVIVVSMGILPVIFVNPRITKKSGAFQTEEGCLSLRGQRKTTRYQTIEVDFMNQKFQSQHQTFTGFVAQIIQHEVDHCEGIVI